MVGDSMSLPRAIGAWISSAAMFAGPGERGDRVEGAVADRAVAVAGPWNTPIHSGRCEAQRFSKNDCSSTPFGYRRSVTPRSPMCGTITGATRT